MRETRVRSLGQKTSLEKEMTTHSSTLAWEIPWTKEPGVAKESDQDWMTKQQQVALLDPLHLKTESLYAFPNLFPISSNP